jgi:hypothetical protein
LRPSATHHSRPLPERKQAVTFLKKSNQKTFASLRAALNRAKRTKSFARRPARGFFQKALLAFLL